MQGREGLVIDCFAGGGGASVGIERALGRPVDIAINHQEIAIAMHRANHPRTRHMRRDMREVAPKAVCRTPPALVWMSPDCTHFSRARGGRPTRGAAGTESRELPWTVVDWAREVHPEIIIVENVPEFTTWGPLDPETGLPLTQRRGETFAAWLAAIKEAGYHAEHRVLIAYEYGTPTARKRWVLVARRDGERVRWPKATHGPGGHPVRTAAECIEWERPVHSIFMDRMEARRVGCRRPLAPATLRRIAAGMRRFVLETERPFIVPITHGGSGSRVIDIDRPMPTVTCAHRGEFALAVADTGTQVPDRRQEVAAFMLRHFGTSTGHSMRTPMGTITADGGGKCVLVEARLGEAHDPGAERVEAFITQYYSNGGAQARAADTPCPSITTRDRIGVVTVGCEGRVVNDIGLRMLSARELFRAQGLPESYDIDAGTRRLTKTEQVWLCGNSVPPQMVEAVVRAQMHAQ